MTAADLPVEVLEETAASAADASDARDSDTAAAEERMAANAEEAEDSKTAAAAEFPPAASPELMLALDFNDILVRWNTNQRRMKELQTQQRHQMQMQQGRPLERKIALLRWTLS